MVVKPPGDWEESMQKYCPDGLSETNGDLMVRVLCGQSNRSVKLADGLVYTVRLDEWGVPHLIKRDLEVTDGVRAVLFEFAEAVGVPVSRPDVAPNRRVLAVAAIY